MTEAIKHDKDKLRFDLLPMDAVEEIVKVLTKGAEKYAPDNWRVDGGFKWHRLIRAAYGHLAAFHQGEDIDPEWGLSHLAHLGCCVLFLLHYQKYPKAYPKDDRYKMNAPDPMVIKVSPELAKVLANADNTPGSITYIGDENA